MLDLYKVWRQQSEDCRQRNGGILLTGCRSNCLVGGQTADKCEDSRMKTADSYLVVGQTVWLEVELQTHQWGESRGQTADSTQQKKKIRKGIWNSENSSVNLLLVEKLD